MAKMKSKNAEINQKLSQLENPFEGLPLKQRVTLLKAISEEAKKKLEYLSKEEISTITSVEPIHALAMAGFMLVFASNNGALGDTQTFTQHEAELIQALLLRHKLEGFKGIIGVPDHFEAISKYARQLSETRIIAAYGAVSDDEAEHARQRVLEAMRLHTQVIRGDFYPEQLTRIFRRVLGKIDERFLEYHKVSATTFFDFMHQLAYRIEEKINTHINKLKKFMSAETLADVVKEYKAAFPEVEINLDEINALQKERGWSLQHIKIAQLAHSNLRVPDIFSISLDEIGEILKILGIEGYTDPIVTLIDQMSLRFGELSETRLDYLHLDNPVWQKPLVRVDKRWLWPLPTTFNSYAPEIFRKLCSADDQLKATYEDARADILEVVTGELIQHYFKGATIWRGVHWTDPKTGKTYENDWVILLEGHLILIECKSGRVAESARRGSYDRLKVEIEKLMIVPAEQSARFAEHILSLEAPKEFKADEGGTCRLGKPMVQDVVRATVTFENIGNLNSQARDLIEARLIPPQLDLAPTISIGFFDVVLRSLNIPTAIVHYLQRRKRFEILAQYFADELDLLSFYFDTGFNVRDVEAGNTMLMIYGYSNKFDAELTRLAAPVSAKQLPVSVFWERILATLEDAKPKDWFAVSLLLRNLHSSDQSRLERFVRNSIQKAPRKGPRIAAGRYGPPGYENTLMIVTRGGEFGANELENIVSEKVQTFTAEFGAPVVVLVFDAPVMIRPSRIGLIHDLGQVHELLN